MALKISADCVNCDICEPECPNQAIYLGQDHYEINAHRCTECVGHFDVPQCQVVCPVDCIQPDPACPETKAALSEKADRLKSAAMGKL